MKTDLLTLALWMCGFVLVGAMVKTISFHGDDKTEYSPWIKTQSEYTFDTCYRIVYHRNGSIRKQNEWDPFGVLC